jgi:hypothetical protein
MSEANDSDCLDYVVERVIVSNVFRPTYACTQSTLRAGGGPRSIDDCRSAACPAGSRADFSQRDADTLRISMLSGRIQDWIDHSLNLAGVCVQQTLSFRSRIPRSSSL